MKVVVACANTVISRQSTPYRVPLVHFELRTCHSVDDIGSAMAFNKLSLDAVDLKDKRVLMRCVKPHHPSYFLQIITLVRYSLLVDLQCGL